MDTSDIEPLALEAYERADADPDDPPSVFELVERLLGTSVERVANMVTLGATYHLRGRDYVVVKSSLPIQRAAHVCGHELSHLLIREAGLRFDDEERAADLLGAALVMPFAFVRHIYRSEGFAPRALAEQLVVTQTSAALRLSEVIGMPIAAVTPTLIRVRGPSAWVWPEEVTIRRWTTHPHPGITRVRLDDEPRRVALVADEDATG